MASWLWDCVTDKWGYRRGLDLKLEEQVKQSFGFLFAKYDARVTSNYYDRRHFGNAYVDVDACSLIFHIVRDRDFISVYLVDPSAPRRRTKYIDISIALAAAEMGDLHSPFSKRLTYSNLEQAAQLVEQKLPKLIGAFSPSRLKTTQLKIERIDAYYHRQSRK